MLFRSAVGSLDVIEIGQEPKFFKNCASGGCALGGRGGFASIEILQRLHDSGINPCRPMPPRRVVKLVRLDQSVKLRSGVMREDVGEDRIQVKSNEAFEVVERQRFRNMP